MPFGRGYLAFLALFWMTAPMAWLYGVPYERHMAPEGALAFNLLTLGFVSVWRVCLSAWMLAVIFGVSMWRTLMVVMLFSDIVLLLALMFAPLPPIDVMGGMERTPHDALLADTAFTAGFFGVLTFPVWLIGTGVAAVKARTRPLAKLGERGPMPRGAVWGSAAILAAWVVATVVVQRGLN
jgi:hypothetical protein